MGQDEHAPTWQAVNKLDAIRKVLGIGVQDDVVGAVKELKFDYDELQDSASRECRPEYIKCLATDLPYNPVRPEDTCDELRNQLTEAKVQRDAAELAAIYFAKRLEYQYHAD